MSTTLRRLALPLALALPAAQADTGNLDPTFSGDGRAAALWPEQEFVQVQTQALATLPDGSVVLAGFADRGDNNRDMALVRFRADGQIDTQFGVDGFVVIAFDLVAGGDDRALGVFPAPGGGLLVAGVAGVDGSPSQWPAFARLTASGDLDPGFGSGGKRVTATQPWSGAQLLFTTSTRDASGRIVLAGQCGSCGHGGLPDMLAARFDANGVLDAGFGNAGYFSFGREGSDGSWGVERAVAASVDGDGRIVLGGHEETYTDPGERQRPLLVRTTVDGELDASFGDDGVLMLDLLGSYSVGALASDPLNDSQVASINVSNLPDVVPGTLLLRVRSTGALDTTFGDGGFLPLGREEGTSIDALAIDAARRITAAGWIDPNGGANHRDIFLARSLFDGTLDASFDGNGVKRVAMDVPDCLICDDRATAIGFSDGRVVVAGVMPAYIAPDQRDASVVLRLQSARIFADGME
ncbi:delta-60 repeat domain-containing protein [Chiayiivirga flava]|uniref:Putative delta-60 repeat protein n=1 Tax=Chiayiivirga flava TaxID=659595 RepID=A0A7W8G0J4_9GAMM|nr:delta-60 repeat domain-containing protein [Chiayiivirga flava]MBB5208389.1 putative delta-60 repeat protein [Chiayiivirga flava]